MRKIIKLVYKSDKSQHEEYTPQQFEDMSKDFQNQKKVKGFLLVPTDKKAKICNTINSMIQPDLKKRVNHDELKKMFKDFQGANSREEAIGKIVAGIDEF